MIRVELAPYVVTFPDLDSARDFMILASGAQRLVKLGPVGVRRLEPPRSGGPKTIDEIADKHARVPVRIAEPRSPAPSTEPERRATTETVTARPSQRRPRSPLMEHVTAAPSDPEPRAPAHSAPEPTGRRTGVNSKRIHEASKTAELLAIVQRGGFDTRAAAREMYGLDDLQSLNRVQVLLSALRKKGLVDRGPGKGEWFAVGAGGESVQQNNGSVVEPQRSSGGASKRPTLEDLHEHVLAAFAADEAYPVPALAAELFGESTGRTLQKTRLLIEQLIGRGKLERRGVATFRVLDGEDQTDDEEDEPVDEDGFDAGDETDASDAPLESLELDALSSN